MFPSAPQHLLDDGPTASGAEFTLRDAQRAAAAETGVFSLIKHSTLSISS
jgi:hypothetical protein